MSIVNVRFHSRSFCWILLLNSKCSWILKTLHILFLTEYFTAKLILPVFCRRHRVFFFHLRGFAFHGVHSAYAYYFGLFHAFFSCFSPAITFALDVFLWPHNKSLWDWKKETLLFQQTLYLYEFKRKK